MNNNINLDQNSRFDNMTITVKFGGSAVTAENLKIVKEICSDNQRRYCVVSAVGKESDDDVKSTDLLYMLYDEVKTGEKVYKSRYFRQVFDKYNRIIVRYGLKIDCEKLFKKAFENYTNTKRDFLASRGEYLSAYIVSQLIGAQFVDSRYLVSFSKNGKLELQKSIDNIAKAVKGCEKVVMSGFYGNCMGEVKTFSRGGSDISGSLLARATNSDLYENYIDVDGFLVASPKMVSFPRTISHISYSQMREMDFLGADCLHRDSILPLISRNIPIHIRNYHNLAAEGTVVSARRCESGLLSIVQEKLNHYTVKGDNLEFKRLFPFVDNYTVLFKLTRQQASLTAKNEIYATLTKVFSRCEIVKTECYYTQILFGNKPPTKLMKIVSELGEDILSYSSGEKVFSVLSKKPLCQVFYSELKDYR